METIVTKSGKKLMVRAPNPGDAKVVLTYINELVLEDVPILVNEKQTLEDEERYIKEALAEIEREEKIQLLVFDGEKLVGNAQVDRGKYREKHVGVLGISIAKDFRGMGVGYKLAKAVTEKARGIGVKIVVLEYMKINKLARKMYEKLGFIEFGELANGMEYQGKLVSKGYMYKQLD